MVRELHLIIVASSWRRLRVRLEQEYGRLLPLSEFALCRWFTAEMDDGRLDHLSSSNVSWQTCVWHNVPVKVVSMHPMLMPELHAQA